MLTNINTIFSVLNVKHSDIVELDKGTTKKLFQSMVEQSDWRCGLIQELLSIKDKQLFVDMDQHEVKQLLDYVSTFR